MSQNKQTKFMDFKSDGMMNLDLFSTFKASYINLIQCECYDDSRVIQSL